ncbi:MAG: hypothetical protein IJ673_00960 [Treponema sp.]|nr:hypothetical protein [Treponema sp.]
MENAFLEEVIEISKELGLSSEESRIIESVKSAAFEEWRLTFSSQMPITTISQIRQVRALAEVG